MAAEPAHEPLSPWRRPAFRTYWLGQTISAFGSHVTELALPLTAVLVLHATADEMGWLAFARYLPFLLFGLIAGVIVDRLRRRPILIVGELLSAAAVGVVPLAFALHALGMEHLYLAAFALESIGLVTIVASQSFLPTLVGRGALVAASSRLEATHSVAAIGGPSIAGALVAVLSAPLTLLIDAISYVLSALLLATIRVEEPPPIPNDQAGSVVEQLREGFRVVARSPIVAALVRTGATHNFFSRMIDALVVLYLTTDLHLDPVGVGLVFAAGGPGALLGSVASGAVARRIGLGRTIVAMQGLTGISRILLPLAGGPPLVALALVALSEFLLGFARPVFNINQVSLRLAITPDRLHGRLNATMRFVMWGATPFGALAGGLLASSVVGTRATLAIAAVGVLIATLPALLSPIVRLRSVEDAMPAAA